MIDTEIAGTWHADGIVVARSTSEQALATPANPTAMSQSHRQRPVEYAGHRGPIVAGIRPAAYADRCAELARAAGTLKLRVVVGMYHALAARVLAKFQYLA